MKPLRLILLLPIVFIFSCTNTEIGHSKDVNPDAVFFDYRITGEEGDSMITCMLRYRFGGANGTTLVLEDPAKVEIDGTLLPLDSTKYTGAYYELSKPVTDFKGHHTIVFTDMNKKQYKEEFDFAPLSLSTELPEKMKREPFTIKLKGIPEGVTSVRLVMIDTVFSTRDINEMRPVINGQLPIDAQTLSQLRSGPINLEIYIEDERPVKHPTKEGGKIFFTYGVKRQFELVGK